MKIEHEVTEIFIDSDKKIRIAIVHNKKPEYIGGTPEGYSSYLKLITISDGIEKFIPAKMVVFHLTNAARKSKANLQAALEVLNRNLSYCLMKLEEKNNIKIII